MKLHELLTEMKFDKDKQLKPGTGVDKGTKLVVFYNQSNTPKSAGYTAKNAMSIKTLTAVFAKENPGSIQIRFYEDEDK